jgi:hypothetical protein
MEMKMRIALCALVVVLALGGCVRSREMVATFAPPYPEANEGGEPIYAVFEGRVPCSTDDNDKLKVSLVLYQRRDTKVPVAYWLGVVGCGQGDKSTVRQGALHLSQGTKEFSDARVYELDANSIPELRLLWQVNENILLPLDDNRSPRVGNAAWGYMLSRYGKPYGPRTYHWRNRN